MPTTALSKTQFEREVDRLARLQQKVVALLRPAVEAFLTFASDYRSLYGVVSDSPNRVRALQLRLGISDYQHQRLVAIAEHAKTLSSFKRALPPAMESLYEVARVVSYSDGEARLRLAVKRNELTPTSGIRDIREIRRSMFQRAPFTPDSAATTFVVDGVSELRLGDCAEQLRLLPTNSVDACVTDPPYELEYMNHGWDASGIAYNVELWKECLRVLKPGGHLLAFGGTRTSHRMVCAMEDAGFEIVDSIVWIYSTGFPKSVNIGKAIDAQAGAKRKVVGFKKGQGHIPNDRGEWGLKPHAPVAISLPSTDAAKQWDGWGTSLKPSHEPIVMARKSLGGTVSANVQTFGTGGLNIGGCRIRTNGRWPANVILDEAAAAELDTVSHGASRFFYVAKASGSEREAGCEHLPNQNGHPTVKPLTLMRYLCRLVTPPGGVVLDPFAGSGSTGCAAVVEGFRFVGIEADAEHLHIAKARIAHWQKTAASEKRPTARRVSRR